MRWSPTTAFQTFGVWVFLVLLDKKHHEKRAQQKRHKKPFIHTGSSLPKDWRMAALDIQGIQKPHQVGEGNVASILIGCKVSRFFGLHFSHAFFLRLLVYKWFTRFKCTNGFLWISNAN